MAERLDRPFTAMEIKNALWQMHPNKSPGPDGLSPFFFKTNWEVVSESESALCLKILNEHFDVACVNQTLTALISKVENPVLVFEFQPVSLCNMVYKIVSKCLSLRMKPILSKVISEAQSAYVGSGKFSIMRLSASSVCTNYVVETRA